ncbi:HalOD1 output domain-containing protein [Halobiforma nitratireducens]|uniref:Halobacterial output domain-containing protein n=1 Tax=Halobiforma nitratireducens JCM 10879 TaxID=1227454 RepID=M0MAY2_9EURY|nr:HalOD1 output domain-containing protein [Halobiforma nitratireducens]EMA41804.1 hypothetical protein C446_05795 [Halobiforma nitratireducens JCM 10879]
MTDDSPFDPTIHRDTDTGTLRVHHDWAGPKPLSGHLVAVVRRAPELEFADGERLFDAVDPEALDSLFEPISNSPRRSGDVRIEFRQFTVTVSADGEVVFDPDADSWWNESQGNEE